MLSSLTALNDHEARAVARSVVQAIVNTLTPGTIPQWEQGARKGIPYFYRNLSALFPAAAIPVEIRLVGYEYARRFLDLLGDAGAAVDYSGETLVVVWPVLQQDGTVQQLSSARQQELFHEFVHVLDDLNPDEDAAPFLSGDYYNSPREFKAYFLMGADEIEKHIEALIKSHGPMYVRMIEQLGAERAWYFFMRNGLGWDTEENYLDRAYDYFPAKWVHYLNQENKALLEQKLLELREHLLAKYKLTEAGFRGAFTKRTAMAFPQGDTYGVTVYHGSREPDLKYLERNLPSYKGGVGGGVYVDFDPEVALFYGDYLYELKLLVHEKEIFYLEPNHIEELYGHSLLVGESVNPFWFEIDGDKYAVVGGEEDDLPYDTKAFFAVLRSMLTTPATWAVYFKKTPYDKRIAAAIWETYTSATTEDDWGNPVLDEDALFCTNEDPLDETTWDYVIEDLQLNDTEVAEDLEAGLEIFVDEKLTRKNYGLSIDLGDIGAEVEHHGYKALYVEGVRGGFPDSELLVFDPGDLQMVGEVERPERSAVVKTAPLRYQGSVYREAVVKTAYKPDDYWYHVTVAKELPNITQNGLRPLGMRGVHFSERTAVPRWYQWVSSELPHRDEELGEVYWGDDPDTDPKLAANGLVPVVLRVPKGFPTEPDRMGTVETEVWMKIWIERYYPELFEQELGRRPDEQGNDKYFDRRWREEQKLKQLEKSFIPYAKAVYTKEGVNPDLISIYNSYEWVPLDQWKTVPLEKAINKHKYLYPPHKNPLVPTL